MPLTGKAGVIVIHLVKLCPLLFESGIVQEIYCARRSGGLQPRARKVQTGERTNEKKQDSSKTCHSLWL